MFSASLRNLSQQEVGASSIEYALLAFLIATVCALIVTAVGANTLALFEFVCSRVVAAAGGPNC